MKLVVAIDGRDSAQSALEFIAKQNYTGDTQVHLVHVIVPGFADVHVDGLPDVEAEERTEEQAILGDMARSLSEKLNITASIDIVSGEVSTAIAEACKKYDADEVIVPSHARHGFSRLWFGSVADEIVDAAPCTVVVLKMTNQVNKVH